MNDPVILEGKELILDGTKIAWHADRIAQWEAGERFAPVTVDIALTRACNYGCHFCYAMLQENANQVIDRTVIYDFLDDDAEDGSGRDRLVGAGEKRGKALRRGK